MPSFSLHRVATTLTTVLTIATIHASAAHAQLIRIGSGSFTPLTPTITFSEYELGTTNPVYTFTGLAGIGDLTVSFAGAFQGQTVTGTSVRTLTGTPTGPLTLNNSVLVSIEEDDANPTTPVLSGTPVYNGPIVVRFSAPVAFVALDGGFFNAIGGTSITGYDALGNVLGSFSNTIEGIETYGFADASGNNTISGLAFYITGDEPAGFAIDNVRFGSRANLVTVPEPLSFSLLLAGLGGVLVVRRRELRTQHR